MVVLLRRGNGGGHGNRNITRTWCMYTMFWNSGCNRCLFDQNYYLRVSLIFVRMAHCATCGWEVEFKYAISDGNEGWWVATDLQAKAINMFLFDRSGNKIDEVSYASVQCDIGAGQYFNVRNKPDPTVYSGQAGQFRGGEWVEIQDRSHPYLWRSVGKEFRTPSFTTIN
jgi:hypothetical protein